MNALKVMNVLKKMRINNENTVNHIPVAFDIFHVIKVGALPKQKVS